MRTPCLRRGWSRLRVPSGLLELLGQRTANHGIGLEHWRRLDDLKRGNHGHNEWRQLDRHSGLELYRRPLSQPFR